MSNNRNHYLVTALQIAQATADNRAGSGLAIRFQGVPLDPSQEADTFTFILADYVVRDFAEKLAVQEVEMNLLKVPMGKA